jgi:hypothetical protein
VGWASGDFLPQDEFSNWVWSFKLKCSGGWDQKASCFLTCWFFSSGMKKVFDIVFAFFTLKVFIAKRVVVHSASWQLCLFTKWFCGFSFLNFFAEFSWILLHNCVGLKNISFAILNRLIFQKTVLKFVRSAVDIMEASKVCWNFSWFHFLTVIILPREVKIIFHDEKNNWNYPVIVENKKLSAIIEKNCECSFMFESRRFFQKLIIFQK